MLEKLYDSRNFFNGTPGHLLCWALMVTARCHRETQGKHLLPRWSARPHIVSGIADSPMLFHEKPCDNFRFFDGLADHVLSWALLIAARNTREA